MFVGGYISAAGLGLTCPEWPLCPNGVMPDEEYLIEWIHRLVAVASWMNKNADRKIKFTSTFAGVLVVTQITLGAVVIDTMLHAVLVSIHLGVGILLFAMVLLTTLFAFRISKSTIEAKT
jgi:cytochrome c oxidase assembly protein subunit 15